VHPIQEPMAGESLTSWGWELHIHGLGEIQFMNLKRINPDLVRKDDETRPGVITTAIHSFRGLTRKARNSY